MDILSKFLGARNIYGETKYGLATLLQDTLLEDEREH